MLLSSRRLACLGHGNSKPRMRHCATVDRSAVSGNVRQLLDSFWEARGVLDPVHRKRLVDAAEALDAEVVHPLNSAPLSADSPLPGLPASWQLEESIPEVLAASRRLLALQQMLGGGLAPDSSSSMSRSIGAIDVVWMVVREPGLLSADLTQLTGRLLEMKLATYGMDVDVLKVIEAQPALLLSDRWRLDPESLQAAARHATASIAPVPSSPPLAADRDPFDGSGSDNTASGSGSGFVEGSRSTAGPDGTAVNSPGSGAVTSSGSVQQLVQAWQYGIASDGDQEWAVRLAQLGDYRARYGDTCVGFRDGDDAELSRWTTKQRADQRRGELAPERLAQLTSLGFHFDADEAEWCRWFSELLEFKGLTGHASPMPLVTGCDMYLINWCSVQRIARRSRVLSESRIQRLDAAGFDWTGADPLS
ncbi:hypothetical protein VaNZ11_014121 [Volvox africanus]|uniref:Helicase-associated domain-containing protein n=1 Tax=Volvox africanus TaxID=51714 RepID=A0ABQ5SJ26_9CHLO|nr:hypothetical protein VaNZ11_014121 [Volvox africanus]